jgi:hypothetical protein
MCGRCITKRKYEKEGEREGGREGSREERERGRKKRGYNCDEVGSKVRA